MKGIVLAGGSGTRLAPLTNGVTKQLLPVFDKPLIYYPISTLMMAGIRDILVITTPLDAPMVQRAIGDGSQWGVNISFAEQLSPNGIAEAFLIGADFIDGEPVALALGDNIFFGNGLITLLHDAARATEGAHIFSHRVVDPERFGVAEFDANGKVTALVEKPKNPRSDWAVVGLYFYGSDVVDLARSLSPSARGELEITDLNNLYLRDGRLTVSCLGRGYAWFDAGTPESLLDAGTFVRAVELQQGMKICCPEEIAYRLGYIDIAMLQDHALRLGKTTVGRYLKDLVTEEKERAQGARPVLSLATSPEFAL